MDTTEHFCCPKTFRSPPRYLVTLFQDITNKKQAEFDLVKNEAFLEDLVVSRTQCSVSEHLRHKWGEK
jgi:hypothetical protein